MSYKIVITTSLDRYDASHFPKLPVIPRIGESINLMYDVLNFDKYKEYPRRLEVVNVVYFEDQVTIELHYPKYFLDHLKAMNKDL